ncbi:hypothetical protein NEOLEDRAFT_49895 [Neolentinus lepideus HHB14362 ss-1]|uniref:F-box domain-containing protein n=1 Tax=Neolentinus lepideus HHB14362 ss-1 TaxID=1314782 RepID=A0A165WBM5_9AGAM|nr:hypothetical protein NEOLEDRAFT_49895 [Neolentinus lepideus HHB14362 ss-1]
MESCHAILSIQRHGRDEDDYLNKRGQQSLLEFIMIFTTWSEPVRRGETILTRVPADVWFHILECFLTMITRSRYYKRGVATLTLVCRYFCMVCQHHLFHVLKYDVAMDYTDSRGYIRQLMWCQHITKRRPGSTALARSLVIRPLLLDHTEILPSLCNLQSLTLKHLVIDDRILETVLGLESLTFLVLHGCIILRAEEHEPLLPICSKKLGYLECFDNDWHPRISTELLFASVAPSLRGLCTNDFMLSSEWLQLLRHSPLEELMVPYPKSAKHRSSLVEFLNIMPTIRKLHLHSTNNTLIDSEGLPGIRDVALPNLSWVSCPSSCLPQLVPGRPLQGIQVETDPQTPTMKDEVPAITESTATVVHLCLSVSQCAEFVMSDIFPALQTLHVYSGRAREAVSHHLLDCGSLFMSALPLAPAVRSYSR